MSIEPTNFRKNAPSGRSGMATPDYFQCVVQCLAACSYDCVYEGFAYSTASNLGQKSAQGGGWWEFKDDEP